MNNEHAANASAERSHDTGEETGQVKILVCFLAPNSTGTGKVRWPLQEKTAYRPKWRKMFPDLSAQVAHFVSLSIFSEV